MPGFGDFLTDAFTTTVTDSKSRPASMVSVRSDVTGAGGRHLQPLLFPAAFGVATGERFDDVSQIPPGLSIERIQSITLHHAAWIDSIVTTYVLSDGSLFTCANGPLGARKTTYDFGPNEILLAVGGLLGFIKEDLDCSIIDGLMLDYLQFHIKDLETGVVRIVPEDPSSYGSSQGADFFVQGPILAFSGRLAGYVSQIQPYLAKERDADFGLPAPGLPFDDHKLHRRDPIRRIKQIIVRSASWIDGLDLVYELCSGLEATVSHGGPGGIPTVTNIEEDEVLEAVSVCNSGPFPFCDALRFYFSRYDAHGNVIARRTIPDKSSPALGYEYEFGDNLWIRAGRGNLIFAFAGRSGSYIEELACWVRDLETGEETLVQPTKRAGNPSRLSALSTMERSGIATSLHARLEDSHKRSSSSLDVPAPTMLTSTSLVVTVPPAHGLTFSASPQSALPLSLPSSPSLPVSLGRLSVCSSNEPGSAGHTLENPYGLRPENKKKRLSGQLALKWGDEVHRQAQLQAEADGAC